MLVFLFSCCLSFNSSLLGSVEIGSLRGDFSKFCAYDCYFLSCRSSSEGGAFFCSSMLSNNRFERCFFENCSSNIESGAIYQRYGSMRLSDCSFLYCRASRGAQTVYSMASAKNLVCFSRVSMNHSPIIPPDFRGSTFYITQGEHIFRDINISVSKVLSGAGGFISNSAEYIESSFSFLTLTQASYTIGITSSNVHPDPVFKYFSMINNSCKENNVVFAEQSVVFRNSILINNIVATYVHLADPKQTLTRKGKSKKNSTNSETNIIPSQKHIYVVSKVIFEECIFDHQMFEHILNQIVCRNCIEAVDIITNHPVEKPLTPGIQKKTKYPSPSLFSIEIVVMGPFVVVFMLMVCLIMRTTRFRTVSDIGISNDNE